jgi:chromosome segregation ATPase
MSSDLVDSAINSGSADAKEQVKKIEDEILQKINKYNDEIKLAEVEEGKLNKLQSKAYLLSEKQRKSVGDADEIVSELAVLDTEIKEVLYKVLEAKHSALVTIQSLYKEHVEYLSNVAKGLKTKCDSLEERLNAVPKQPSIQDFAAAALNAPTVSPVVSTAPAVPIVESTPTPAPSPVSAPVPAPSPVSAPVVSGKKKPRKNNIPKV